MTMESVILVILMMNYNRSNNNNDSKSEIRLFFLENMKVLSEIMARLKIFH